MRTFFLAIGILITIYAFAQTGNLLRGNQFYKSGQFEQAELSYRKALEEDPDNAIALHNLGNALYRQGKFDEAAKVHGRLAKSAKDTTARSVAWYNQGVSNTKLNQLEASIESYKNALRLNPSDKEARENLEKALLQLKKKQQQQDQKKQQQSSSMSQKQADQKLKQLQQREKELQQKMNQKNQGGGGSQDW